MRRKITIEFIRAEFEKKDWTLISRKYINASSNLDYICPKGHIGAMPWSSWRRGYGCSICAGNKKLTIEFIKSEFEKEGWECTSDEYVNNSTLLNYICSNGHVGSIRWNSWQQGQRCSICAGVKKPTIDFIKIGFEKEGWLLVSKKYINSKTPLKYVCSNGHHNSIRWDSWQQGYRCSICSGKKKHTIEFVKSEFEKEGWICTSDEYINSYSKLNYICPKGHYGVITWVAWANGRRCATCAGLRKLTIEFVRSEFKKKGWVLISTVYINAVTKLEYVCPNGHRGAITWSAWNQGNGCPICYRIQMSKRHSGNKHWNWQGGISKEQYCDIWKDKEYAESIKQRDGYKCLNPCCNSKDPDDLTRHHIEYNKKSCRPKDIITACRSCNSAANYDREWHEAWYKAIMYRRCGYTYDNN